MRVKGHESGKFEDTEEPKVEEGKSEDLSPKDKKGKRWYDYIPVAQIKDKLPKLRNVRGGKVPLRFWTFHEVFTDGQELFDKHKGFFRTRNQVDLLAHYIGMKILHLCYAQGMTKSKLSALLESEEKENALYDDMKSAKEKFKYLIEKCHEGFVTSDELGQKVEALIATFEHKRDQEKVARMFDNLVEGNEFKKAGDRVRQRKHREMEAKVKGLQHVDTE